VQAFGNTEIPVWGVDELATPEALGDWLRSRQLLSDAAVVDADAFVRARALRRVLRELAKCHARGAAPDEALRAEFAAIAAETRASFNLDERGEVRLRPAGDGVNRALTEILARVFEAQAAGVWRRLKSCPGPHCGWVFYDGSRNASSKWCSMSICGNRTKTAAYRERRKAAL
jgi:predicted RNA-binding Zn ribbon-like protein